MMPNFPLLLLGLSYLHQKLHPNDSFLVSLPSVFSSTPTNNLPPTSVYNPLFSPESTSFHSSSSPIPELVKLLTPIPVKSVHIMQTTSKSGIVKLRPCLTLLLTTFELSLFRKLYLLHNGN